MPPMGYTIVSDFQSRRLVAEIDLQGWCSECIHKLSTKLLQSQAEAPDFLSSLVKSEVFLVSSSDIFMLSISYWFCSSSIREVWETGNCNAGGALEEGVDSVPARGLGDKGLETYFPDRLRRRGNGISFRKTGENKA